ncbi:MAG: hypothetical protein ABGW78_05885 [Pirellulales bacterium]
MSLLHGIRVIKAKPLKYFYWQKINDQGMVVEVASDILIVGLSGAYMEKKFRKTCTKCRCRSHTVSNFGNVATQRGGSWQSKKPKRVLRDNDVH